MGMAVFLRKQRSLDSSSFDYVTKIRTIAAVYILVSYVIRINPIRKVIMYNEKTHYNVFGNRIVLYYTFTGPRQSFMNLLGGAKKVLMSSWEMEVLVASLIT